MEDIFHSCLNLIHRRHLILSCQGSLNIFPFDDPLCSFALESSKFHLSNLFFIDRWLAWDFCWKLSSDSLSLEDTYIFRNCYLFSISSVSYEQSAITYVWKNDEDTLRKSPSLTTLNAYLIQNQTIACEIKGSWRGS
jgi:hypothetical protein